MKKFPIVAAIPNYNMGEQLDSLLPSLLAAGYDDIYVLDDASCDGSREITREVSTDVHFLETKKNKGASAARNLILGALGQESIIHFVDADITLDTDRAAEVVAATLPSGEFGFIGGLAKTKSGLQTVWNYGPRQSLRADVGANLQSYIEPLLQSDPERAKRIRKRFPSMMKGWPDPLANPLRRQVYWVIEQNMVVNSRVFEEFGGFDERLREHEIQDLAIRMASKGLKRYFDPLFAITHKEIDVRHYNRTLAKIRAEAKIIRKHGFGNWLNPSTSLDYPNGHSSD